MLGKICLKIRQRWNIPQALEARMKSRSFTSRVWPKAIRVYCTSER